MGACQRIIDAKSMFIKIYHQLDFYTQRVNIYKIILAK